MFGDAASNVLRSDSRRQCREKVIRKVFNKFYVVQQFEEKS